MLLGCTFIVISIHHNDYHYLLLLYVPWRQAHNVLSYVTY